MRTIKVLGLVVIMIVGLSLASTTQVQAARANSANKEVVILVCGNTGIYVNVPSIALSTVKAEDIIMTEADCDDATDICGTCMTELIKVGCTYDSTTGVAALGGETTTVGPQTGFIAITMICP